MSIDEPLLSLDIVGADNDMTNTNCILRQNKTEFLGRNSLDYILSLRDETLSARNYRVPEMWDHEWEYKRGPIWTPDSISANLETWILPEYFKAETNNPTKCIEATNRVDGSVGFEQVTITNMPTLTKDNAFKNFQGLLFDGTRDFMQTTSTSDWNVGTDDFLIATIVEASNSSITPIVSKRDDNRFTLYSKNSIISGFRVEFSMNNSTLLGSYVAGATAEFLVVCGRSGGVPFIFCNGVTTTGSSDTTNLTHPYKPMLGDKNLNTDEFEGSIYEVIFVNDSLTESSVIDSDLIESLAGYLAWKYGKTGLLQSDHTYKNAPPRASVN